MAAAPSLFLSPGPHELHYDPDVSLPAGPVQGRAQQLPAHSVHLGPGRDVEPHQVPPVVDGGPVQRGHVLAVPLVHVKPLVEDLLHPLVGAVLGRLDDVEAAGVMLRPFVLVPRGRRLGEHLVKIIEACPKNTFRGIDDDCVAKRDGQLAWRERRFHGVVIAAEIVS